MSLKIDRVLPVVVLSVGLLVTSMGCGGNAKNEADDFSGKLFDAKLPDTSGVYRQDPTNVEVMSFQYLFNKDTTGEMRLKKGSQLQRIPFVWQVEQDSIRMRFSNVDGRLFVKKLPTGYELFNKQFRVKLTPSE